MTAPLTAETIKRWRIKDALAIDPGGILETLADEYGVSLRTVMDCLPADSISIADGSRFVEILADISSWGDISLVSHTKDAVIGFSGPMPPGRIGSGLYCLQRNGGLDSHFSPERCSAIYFVRRPFVGVDTMSVQFFNSDGGAMFKICVGRDESGKLRDDQSKRFAELEARFRTRTKPTCRQ